MLRSALFDTGRSAHVRRKMGRLSNRRPVIREGLRPDPPPNQICPKNSAGIGSEKASSRPIPYLF
ncbi:MAG: hypothetical protein APR56_08875 [Methanosaeta sp. SDB]|nr:MAG: hypothetical protein APR56_08875 [Methanosaeta sp. SDB]